MGTDEYFFEEDDNGDDGFIRDLYNEKAGILDGDTDVDLASHAYQIWKNAIDHEKGLEKKIKEMPDVVYSAKPHFPTVKEPEGALVYVRTGNDTDALAWVDDNGRSVTESQFAILRAAACEPNTPALERAEKHHEWVQHGVKHVVRDEHGVGGQLGRPSGARFKTYERLKGRDAGGVRPGERTYSVQAEKKERQAKSQSVREFVEVLAEEPQPLELSRVFVEELADRQRWDRKRTQVRASETNETVRDDVVPRKRSENGHHESS